MCQSCCHCCALFVFARVSIVNVNDNPAVSLSGDIPVVKMLNVTYTEGNGTQTILPNIAVIDTDPTAMIQR